MTKAGPIPAAATRAALIAPCGMNCRLCIAFTRERNACPGCRAADSGKPKTRVRCRIKTCAQLKQGAKKFCGDCGRFPCDNLKRLDQRYRTKYGMSMLANLEHIRRHGIRAFVRSEAVRWACQQCGARLCVHKPQCLSCGSAWHKELNTTQNVRTARVVYVSRKGRKARKVATP
ncbi:MAG: DUF3795 domain-containing protein [Kiritimatiellaeota bacterium]|nr:DUF3795 domain-containing protein [Kiritimatiellota bacterium]